MKKPTTHVTTHNHAPAPCHTLDLLALSRAADCEDNDHPAQSWRMAQFEQLESDKKKLEQQLIDAEKQADLDQAALQDKLTNTEYQLRKAQAERAACVLVIFLIAIAAIMVSCGGAV